MGAPTFSPGPNYEEELRRECEALVVEALAEGTNRSYLAGWERWQAYCRLRGTRPFLDGDTREEKKKQEEEVLLFLVH